VYFDRALSVARQQQAKSWGLRAATSMARLGRDRGRRSKVANCLLRFTAGSPKGFDTLDLKEAKALLDELTT